MTDQRTLKNIINQQREEIDIRDKLLRESVVKHSVMYDQILTLQRQVAEAKNARVKVCTLKVRCVDCGENIWCYSDDQLDEMRSERVPAKELKDGEMRLL